MDQITYNQNFTLIMQDFIVFGTLIASKKRIEQLNFFNWISNVENLVLLNGCEHVRNVIQWDYNKFFFQKLIKIAQRLGTSPPDPHIRRRLGAPPVVIRLQTPDHRL